MDKNAINSNHETSHIAHGAKFQDFGNGMQNRMLVLRKSGGSVSKFFLCSTHSCPFFRWHSLSARHQRSPFAPVHSSLDSTGWALLKRRSSATLIANLIMRFYAPVSGSIFLNDQDIKKLSVSEYRAKMAFVTQEPYLFSDTIRANIWRDHANPSESEIARVLEAANCQAVIKKQPQGLDTILSAPNQFLSGWYSVFLAPNPKR